MLIGFVGLPCSGKTTLAVKLFAFLKENAFTSELIVEQARVYIAKKRKLNNISFREPVSLTDDDQVAIYKRQRAMERTITTTNSPKTYVVSDSSIINTLLYCSEELYPNLVESVQEDMAIYNLIFYCHPFDEEYEEVDPNRVHNKEQIMALKSRADKLLNLLKSKKSNKTKFIEVMGAHSLEARSNEVQIMACETYMDFLNTIPIEDL
jgi:molybdopterin-guanine dinucleotide biosynthesis protein